MSLRARLWPVAASLGLVAGAGFSARQLPRSQAVSVATQGRPRQNDDRLVLHVPHAGGSVVLDGDTDDPSWTALPGPARTGPFVSPSGAPFRPYADARLLWGDGQLYIALYAADEDIRSRTDQPDGPTWLDDSFRLVFSRDGVQYVVEVSSNGAVTDAVRKSDGRLDYTWSSGAHVSHDQDGTPNDPTDTDEEWVIEMAVPFESLGVRCEHGSRIGFSARRCDMRGRLRSCGSWGEGPFEGEIILE